MKLRLSFEGANRGRVAVVTQAKIIVTTTTIAANGMAKSSSTLRNSRFVRCKQAQ